MAINSAVFEDLVIQAKYLSNLAMCIATAMFDADIEAANCEGAMRFFAERLVSFSAEMNRAYSEAD